MRIMNEGSKGIAIRFAAIVAAACICSSGIVAVAKTSVNVSGGTWEYDTILDTTKWQKYSYSKYYHGTKKHSASVVKGNTTSRDVQSPGKWAVADLWYDFTDIAHVYYNSDVE